MAPDVELRTDLVSSFAHGREPHAASRVRQCTFIEPGAVVMDAQRHRLCPGAQGDFEPMRRVRGAMHC